MKFNARNTVLALGAMVMLGLTSFPAAAQALAPNSINNETIDTSHDSDVPLNIQRGGAGVYDHYDPYRTPEGFPLPGWGHLRGMS
jgi:hypothetical protein